ncbi:unnamed protein product [Macrosiphum euphorbiae]|uniref:Uncharacterized protein n=1 Tax=Macrosiphum euphorbiae TaxID=13131 RepID=A0AAV0XFW8_9HEMI|nr:unnamed protein product [Macrosiphum euphorbiae]
MIIIKQIVLYSRYLSHNKIKDIETELFSFMTEYVSYLSNNIISDLKDGAFVTLEKLRILKLDKNKIENIETGVFNSLKAWKSYS